MSKVKILDREWKEPQGIREIAGSSIRTGSMLYNFGEDVKRQ